MFIAILLLFLSNSYYEFFKAKLVAYFLSMRLFINILEMMDGWQPLIL